MDEHMAWISLLQALRGLVDEGDRLAESMAGQHLAGGLLDEVVDGCVTSRILACYRSFHYQDDQAPDTTLTLHGWMQVTSGVMDAVEAMNQQKRQVGAELTTWRKVVPAAVGYSRHGVLAERLRQAGFGRLNLLQCLREIPIARGVVDSVGFSWVTQQKKYRPIESDKVMGWLEIAGMSGETADRYLASYEVGSFRSVYAAPPGMVANLKSGEERWRIRVPIPLVLPHGKYPIRKPKTSGAPADRASRSDRRYHPLLPGTDCPVVGIPRSR